MKQLMTFALVAGLALVACSKKNAFPRPGDRPANDPNAATRPGQVPAKIALDANDALIGSWQSQCVKETYSTKPQPHITQNYYSYRIYLTVEASKMRTNLLRFISEDCRDMNFSIEILPPHTWDFTVQKHGSIDSPPWEITYTTYDGAPISEDGTDIANVGRVFEGENYHDELKFDSDSLIYTRSN